MSGGRVKVVVLVAVLAAFTTLVTLLATDVVAVPNADEVSEFLTDTGVVGPVVFAASMWALQPLGVPGFTWMVPAGLVWPWPLGVLMSWIGNMGASTIAVGFARWTARDWVQPRIPGRVRQFEERLSHGGVGPVLVLRVFTSQFVPADWLVGVSRVRWPAILVGTGLGILPGIFFFVIVGGSLFDWLGDTPPAVRRSFFAAIIAVAVGRRLLARRTSKPADDAAGGDQTSTVT